MTLRFRQRAQEAVLLFIFEADICDGYIYSIDDSLLLVRGKRVQGTFVGRCRKLKLVTSPDYTQHRNFTSPLTKVEPFDDKANLDLGLTYHAL